MDLGTVFNSAAQVASFVPYVVGAYAAYRVAKSSVFTVDQMHEGLVTTFGKFSRKAKPGINFKAPWPIQKVEAEVPLSLQQTTENLHILTKDDMNMTLPITLQYEVKDAEKFYFNVSKPIDQIVSNVNVAVRSEASHMTVEEIFKSRDQISDKVTSTLSQIIGEYGIQLKRVLVDQPRFSDKVQAAYDNVKASEKLREATKNEAEANKIRIVAQSEADMTASENFGLGLAKQREAIFANYAKQLGELKTAGLTEDQSVSLIGLAMTLDTLRDAAQKGNVIITTTNAETLVDSMVATGKALGKKGGTVAPFPAPHAA